MALLAPSLPNPYTAAADLLEDLPLLVQQARIQSGLTVKVQAKQIGIQLATLTRLESGSVPNQTTIIQCLRWLAIYGD